MSFTLIEKIFPPNLAYRNFIFIPLFLVFYLVLTVFDPSVFLLQHFTNRSVSIATLEGIDIGKRVSLFYKAIGFAFVLILLFTRLTIILKNYINNDELLIANGISLAGFCILFFQLLGADMSDFIHFLFALLIVCLAGFTFHQVKKRDARDFTAIFLWTILISISLFFLQWQVAWFMFGKIFFSLPKIIVLAGVPIYLLFTYRFKLNYKILKASYPLIFLPLLSFISDELFMILNQRGIYVTPKIVYTIGLVIILIISYFFYRKPNSLNPPKPILTLLFRNWMPWILAGIACIAFYHPIIKPDIDWFENANHVLPLHQWFSFGKIPFLDSFSSHSLSDFGFGLLYSFFNGADPMGVFVYSFMIGVVVIIITYFFIYKITGDGFLATWIALAYPYTDLLIPSYFNLVPLTVIAFILLYEKQTVGRYIFFFSSLIFMIIWRIDLGSSTLIAGTLGLIFLAFFVPTFNTNKKYLFKGLVISISLVFLLFIIALIHSGAHLLISIKDALAYMSSFQSYGIKDLSLVHDMKYFSLYYILPVVILLIIIHCIYRVIRQNEKENNTIIYTLAIIFLGIFYLSNLQRGLVRHTLAENWDTALTSFGFFIIASIILIKYLNKNPFLRFFIFFIAGTVLISNYVFTYPDRKKNNYYSSLTNRLKNPLSIPFSKEKILRIFEDPSNRSRYSEFTTWMNNNFTGKATFLDFSNSPMLYYYSNRIVPNYFDQIPHTAHNEYLQNRFLDDLKNYDIPVTVFSNVPQNFWDNLDGIPNALRHYRISEYIYRNYQPSYIINNHSIWLKKGLKIKDNEKKLLSVSVSDMIASGITFKDSNEIYVEEEHGFLNYQLKTPLLYEKYKPLGPGWNYQLTGSLTYEKYKFASMGVTSSHNCDVIIQYKTSNGTFNEKQKTIFKIHKGYNTLSVMFEPLENDIDISLISISLPYGTTFKFSQLTIFSSDYYKDFVSNISSDYYLKWIPYIWGSYDENYTRGKIEKVGTVFSGNKLLGANHETKFDFMPVLEKESGNYFLINARVISGQQTEVSLNYGDGNQKSGSFSFTLKNDTLNHDYLIRVSAQYNWYCKTNSWLSINPAANDIELTKAEILKGD